MKLNNIFATYSQFKEQVIDKLILLFPNAEWLNEQNSYMSFQTLYGMLMLYYGDRDIRYDNSYTFINKFTFELADLLPDIYSKQQVFITNELNKYLSSADNRAVRINTNNSSQRNQNSNSSSAGSSTPTNIVVTKASELANIPVTTAQLGSVDLIDDINGTNEQINLNYIDNITKALNSDYSLRLKEFMNMLIKHFRSIDTSNVISKCDGLYKGTRFRNGYYVSNVDYLGLENAAQIKLTNNNVMQNTLEIEKLKGQNNNVDLSNFYTKNQTNELLNNYYNKTETDNLLSDFDSEIDDLQSQITNINGSLVGQDEFNTLQTQVNTNTTNITTNANNLTNTNNKLNRVITELQNSTLINYNGEWVDGTSAKLGQVYSYNGAMYLCKVENTTNAPTNTDDWDLISSTEVNLSNYYNKLQIDDMLSDINTNITNLQTTLNNDIQELGNELNSLIQSVDNLGSTYLSKEAFIREYTDNTNRNIIQVGWDIDVPPPSDPNVSTPVENFYRLIVKQKYTDDYVADDILLALWNKKTNNPDLSMEINYGTYNCPYIDNLETNLQNQINELKDNAVSNQRTLYFAGQVIYFKTKAQWEAVANRLNLQSGVDYEISEMGRYVMTGENGGVGGSNIVKEENIQYMTKNIIRNNAAVYSGKINNDSTSGYCQRHGGGKNTNYTAIGNLINSKISIGWETPNEFKPKYVQRYEVIILRDIVVGGTND